MPVKLVTYNSQNHAGTLGSDPTALSLQTVQNKLDLFDAQEIKLVTKSKKSQLPRTQQQDTLSPSHDGCTH